MAQDFLVEEKSMLGFVSLRCLVDICLLLAACFIYSCFLFVCVCVCCSDLMANKYVQSFYTRFGLSKPEFEYGLQIIDHWQYSQTAVD